MPADQERVYFDANGVHPSARVLHGPRSALADRSRARRVGWRGRGGASSPWCSLRWPPPSSRQGGANRAVAHARGRALAGLASTPASRWRRGGTTQRADEDRRVRFGRRPVERAHEVDDKYAGQKTPKTKRSKRPLALHPLNVAALRRHREEQKLLGLYDHEGFVFCTRNGTPMSLTDMRRSFKKLCLRGDRSALSPRTVERRFRVATGLTRGAVAQIERVGPRRGCWPPVHQWTTLSKGSTTTTSPTSHACCAGTSDDRLTSFARTPAARSRSIALSTRPRRGAWSHRSSSSRTPGAVADACHGRRG